jgi:hypothetical protein
VNVLPETITTPSLTGTSFGTIASAFTYTANSATSNLGHAVQYQFDWGDGTTSSWLSPDANGSATQSHTWTAAGPYIVTAVARCGTYHRHVLSGDTVRYGL